MSVEQYWKSLSGWPGLRSEREKGVRMKIGGKGGEGERDREGMIPNIMTATSTEHKTPSS